MSRHSPRLRIAFVTSRFGHQFGGAEAYGVELMKELSRHHDITVIGYEYDPDCGVQLPFIPIKESRLPLGWLKNYLFARRVSRLLANSSYHLVHSHVNGWSADVDVLHVRSVNYRWQQRLGRIQRVFRWLNPRIQMYRWLEKKRIHLQPPRRTVAVSGIIKEQIQSAYDTQLDFDVIPPGVRIHATDPQVRQQVREDLGLTDEDCLGMLVARNPERKGLPVLLEVLPRLELSVKLLVVGPHIELIPGLQAQVAALGLQGRVLFQAQTPEIRPYYQAADFYVHPTLNDSFGMAPLEAMSYGLPVLMSDARYCGFAQYVTDGENALLLSDPMDGGELWQQMQRLLQDKSLYERLQQGARALAEQFDWAHIAQRYEGIYADILAA